MANTVYKSKGVILWDMDGTLISPIRESNESPHLNAVKKNGFNPQGQNPGLIGSTDFEVISSLLSFYPGNESENVLEKCFKDLNDISLSLYQSNSFSLCQGLPKALIKIKEIGWDNGILTGNTNTRMFKKLEILKMLIVLRKLLGFVPSKINFLLIKELKQCFKIEKDFNCYSQITTLLLSNHKLILF